MTSPVTIGACVGMHPPMNIQVGLSSPDFGLLPAPLGYEMPAGSSGESSSSDTHSPEAPMPKASDRESRIRAEKQRRSQYNAQISQMMTLLSDVVHSQRKIDKTSVLRLAANKLRNEHVFGNSIKCGHVDTWSSSFMKIFDLFGGVMLGVTCRGRIFIVSPNVQEKLGYSHIDLLGQDLFNYVYPEDKDILTHNIYPSELQQNPCDERLLQGRRNFTIRIMRAGTRSDPPRYERCRIDGMLRRSDRATSNTVQDEQIIRRPRVRHTRTFPSSGNDYVFIGMIYFQTQTALPPRILPPTAYSEYWTRHLIDGRIVQCDQSISLAIGYMTEEVTGTSAFVFMHKDDVRWVVCVLRQMYDQNKEFGESYYRLMSRSGHFTYMRTRGFLEIDRDTKQVQSFVCVNNVIGEEYGKRMMADMKRKYSVVVDLDQLEELQESNDDIPVEHPKQMERIVMHLLEPATSDVVNEKLKLVPPSKENIISAIKSSERVVQETGVRFDSRKRKSSDWEGNGDYLKRRSELLDITDL